MIEEVVLLLLLVLLIPLVLSRGENLGDERTDGDKDVLVNEKEDRGEGVDGEDGEGDFGGGVLV